MSVARSSLYGECQRFRHSRMLLAAQRSRRSKLIRHELVRRSNITTSNRPIRQLYVVIRPIEKILKK